MDYTGCQNAFDEARQGQVLLLRHRDEMRLNILGNVRPDVNQPVCFLGFNARVLHCETTLTRVDYTLQELFCTFLIYFVYCMKESSILPVFIAERIELYGKSTFKN